MSGEKLTNKDEPKFIDRLTKDEEERAKQLNFTGNFDFTNGDLIKSPCKECKNRPSLPSCVKDCIILRKIQDTMVDGVSSRNQESSFSEYTIPEDVGT